MATDPTQRTYRAPCPGCGAPVEFKSAQSTHAVCGYCQSTVVRSGDVLTRLGKMAELWSLVRTALQPVLAGTWRGFAPDDEGLLERFARLYDWHIAAEDELVFPAVAQALDDASLTAIAKDMARRHGAL